MFLYLQTTKHVRFCCCDFIKYSGIIPIVAGAVLSTWAFLILGTDRSSQVNFFVENVPVVKRSVYKYLKNPQYLGLWLMLAGVTLFTESVYNLVITVEFILLMAPLAWLENRMLQKNKT
jgi:protein-S-isoprenylcysteine O-methyltransferase Ste14